MRGSLFLSGGSLSSWSILQNENEMPGTKTGNSTERRTRHFGFEKFSRVKQEVIANWVFPSKNPNVFGHAE
jgi:hypothetical protein